VSTDQIDQPFDSIESAQAFMEILAETIFDAMKDLNFEQQLAAESGAERRAKAVELALFKLKMLTCYVQKSRRTLNDLRMLRRLILNERETVESALAAL
jgi:hypothetical protein